MIVANEADVSYNRFNALGRNSISRLYITPKLSTDVARRTKCRTSRRRTSSRQALLCNST